MNTNTNLAFIQSHSFPFFNRQQSSKEPSDNISLKKSALPSSCSNVDPKIGKIERRKKRIRQTKQCCKRFFTFLFSHIGLSAVVVGYVILGGIMFRRLEINNEQVVKESVRKNQSHYIRTIINNFKEYHYRQVNSIIKNQNEQLQNHTYYHINVTGDLEILLTKILNNYTKHMIHFMQDLGWNGHHDDKDLNWSYEGALLYVITVITTIGYGHVAPKTSGGKFMTMLYALLGIPLTFLYLSNIGDYLADWFRFVYHKICRKYCTIICQRTKRSQPTNLRSALISAKHLPGMSRPSLTNSVLTNNIFHRTYKQFQNRYGYIFKGTSKRGNSSLLKNKNDDKDSSSNLDEGPISSEMVTLKSAGRDENNFCYKSYGIARYLPSVKTVQQREALMLNCISSHIPLVNWKDIDADLEVGSLENIALESSYNNSTTDDIPPSGSAQFKEAKLKSYLQESKSKPLHRSMPYFPSESDSPILSNSNGGNYRGEEMRTSVSNDNNLNWDVDVYSPDFNFTVGGVRRVSYVSLNSLADHTNDEVERNQLNQITDAAIITLNKSTVPISLSFATLFIYIVFGSVIFTIWEDKDYLKWSYFCFITLSTIGFGDIVPGTKVDSENPKEKLILVSFYVIMGLSVFAMCFKLMQEEVIAKFKRLGHRLGILKNKKKKKKKRMTLIDTDSATQKQLFNKSNHNIPIIKCDNSV